MYFITQTSSVWFTFIFDQTNKNMLRFEVFSGEVITNIQGSISYTQINKCDNQRIICKFTWKFILKIF